MSIRKSPNERLVRAMDAGSLRPMVKQMLASGVDRTYVLGNLEYLRGVNRPDRSPGDDKAVVDAMNAVAGWTNPRQRL